MMLWIVNLVRLGGVDRPECSSAEIVPQIPGVGKIPRFKVPLCICALDRCPDMDAQALGQFFERIQNLIGRLPIHIQKDNELVWRIAAKEFIPCSLYQLFRHRDAERLVSRRDTDALHRNAPTLQMLKQKGKRMPFRLPRSQNDYFLATSTGSKALRLIKFPEAKTRGF